MMSYGNDTLRPGTLPTATALGQLRRRLYLPPDAQDVHLAYTSPLLRLTGFLVTGKGEIDRVIAYCPLSPALQARSKGWSEAVLEQLDIAARVARRPEAARRSPDVIWLGYAGTGEREVPHWLFGMRCVPLTYEWDGTLLSPRPFCPTLFERMAGQPQAARWLMNRLASPMATAGGSETPSAAPTFNPFALERAPS